MSLETKFETYSQKTARWRNEYSVGKPYRIVDLTTISTTGRSCKKCGKKYGLHRHHKGHEYLFACLDEKTYAERYIKFHKEDVEILCNKCHEKIHKIYDKILVEFYDFYNQLPNRSGVFVGGHNKDTGELNIIYDKTRLMEFFRLKLVEKFNKWVLIKPRKRKKRRK